MKNSFLRVADLARAAGVDAHVARFYARIGLIRATKVTANGYRQFVPLDVKRVRFIRTAQGLGFSLAEIKEIMRRSWRRRTPCPLVRDIIVKRLAETGERLLTLQELQSRMLHAIDRWQTMPDGVPNGDVICALIETMDEEPPAPDAPPSSGARRLSQPLLRAR